MFLKLNPCSNSVNFIKINAFNQGTLTEGEGSVQLTSLY
jgi:hypothetical protein